MKKRGARIKHTRQSSPTLVALHLAPEVENIEQTAAYLLNVGKAETRHFNQLLDCQHMLLLAAADKGDEEAVKISQFADIAMKSIRQRQKRTGKIGATGDEMQAINLLVDYSQDWWKRQSGVAFADAYSALDKLREQQKEAA